MAFGQSNLLSIAMAPGGVHFAPKKTAIVSGHACLIIKWHDLKPRSIEFASKKILKDYIFIR